MWSGAAAQEHTQGHTAHTHLLPLSGAYPALHPASAEPAGRRIYTGGAGGALARALAPAAAQGQQMEHGGSDLGPANGPLPADSRGGSRARGVPSSAVSIRSIMAQGLSGQLCPQRLQGAEGPTPPLPKGDRAPITLEGEVGCLGVLGLSQSEYPSSLLCHTQDASPCSPSPSLGQLW